MPDRLEVTLADDLSEISRLAEMVEAFGEAHDVPMKAMFNLNLALDELITNTISYGLTEGGDRTIDVAISVVDGFLVTDISDGGRAFDPFADAPPPDLESSIEDRAIGGLGVHLVKTLIPSVAYRRDGERNRVTLRQPLG